MASDSETFKLILQQIEKLNHNLESASFATNNLTMQISQAKDIITVTSELQPQPNTDEQKEALPANGSRSLGVTSELQPQLNTDEQGKALPENEHRGRRSLGYVNWNDSYEEIFKSQRLIGMSNIKLALDKVRGIGEAVPNSSHATAIVQHSKSNTNTNSQKSVISGQFSFAGVYQLKVDRYSRFPMDAVYIDVDSPVVKEEIKFMNNLTIPPPEGVIDRFLSILEMEMHTYKTFEKHHGLKWVLLN